MVIVKNNIKKYINLYKNSSRSVKINFIFLSVFILSVFITIFQFIFSAVNAKYIFEYPLFQRVRNILFSDFYHVNDMVFENSPYFEDQSSYPPFVLFLAKFFALFGDYSKGYGTVVTQPLGVVAVVIYYGLFFASFCFLTYYLFKKDSWKNWHIAIVLVCFFISAPMIFQFERGNYIIYALLFSLIFLCFYNHENKFISEIALISLACSVGVKLYPCLFAVLLLKEKKFAKFIRTACYSVIILILPFLFFEKGFSNIERFLYWLTAFSGNLTDYGYNYSIVSTVEIIATFFGHKLFTSNETIALLQKILPIIILVFLGISSLFAQKTWQSLCLVTIIIIFFPNISFAYALCFLIIPIYAFLLEKEKSKIDYFYMALLFLSVCPAFLGYYLKDFAVLINQVVSTFSLILLSLGLVVETIVFQTKNLIKNKKNAN